MSRKIIYLINPIAGTKAKEILKEQINLKTRAAGIDFEILPTTADGKYDRVRHLIETTGFTDVVVCGGDGTVNNVAGALRGLSVNLGIIPIGSGNSLALATKIPKNIGQALEIIFRGKSSPIDAFLINDRFSCVLCGIGFDAEVAHEFARQKTRGLQTYIRISTMKFFKCSPYPFEIEFESQTIRTEAFFISIANSNQFGNNVTIAPRASLSDGLLDLVIVKKMNKVMLPISVLLQVAGNNRVQEISDPGEKRNIIYVQTNKMLIRNPARAPLHIDGEPAQTSDVFNIELIPDCFRLLQP